MATAYPKLEGVKVQPGERVVTALVVMMGSLAQTRLGQRSIAAANPDLESELEEKIGSFFAGKILQEGGRQAALAVLDKPA